MEISGGSSWKTVFLKLSTHSHPPPTCVYPLPHTDVPRHLNLIHTLKHTHTLPGHPGPRTACRSPTAASPPLSRDQNSMLGLGAKAQ